MSNEDGNEEGKRCAGAKEGMGKERRLTSRVPEVRDQSNEDDSVGDKVQPVRLVVL